MTLLDPLRWAVVAAVVVLSAPSASAQGRHLKADEAKAHVGERATVCGTVVSSKYLAQSNKLTMLNFDRPYPNQPFTAIIYPEVRAQFAVAPDSFYLRKEICVSGPITVYRDQPQIIVASTKDLAAKK